ncbi:MAG: aerotolerance regulator BatA [Ignavibacteriales bacterium CG12_big_fil_rev_8_21_14_0_65_30_8]|nr:MAG: aerotolerance regulator BatA [Ignavibacteriales bacterium CG12_big_fil_rev_8_21_14_0_65_30_8]
MFNEITFAYPWILYLLLLIPLMVFWYFKKGKNRQPSIVYSSFNVIDGIPKNWKEKLRHLPMVLRVLSLTFLIIALARPQTFSSGQNIYSEGIDIVMDLDISGSMLAQDLKPNRLDAAKNVIDNFIKERTTDRIGLVIFSRDAFTQCPLTIDYNVLTNLLDQVKTGMIEDGTAIGNAIANGVNRLRESKAKSKIIILLTDGMNNAGEVDPMSAAQIAKTFGIRIYTVGVGTRGEAPYPVQTPFGIRTQMVPVNIDEAMLKKIADETGGEYFRATSTQALKNIYDQIDKLEKTKIEVISYRNAKEMFGSYLGLGLLFFFLDIAMIRSIFRPIP